jgi:hypothetical protein
MAGLLNELYRSVQSRVLGTKERGVKDHDEEQTHLLNVDLDIVSRSPLDTLVQAFEGKVDVLHVGKLGRRYSARLEVGGSGYRAEANRLVRRFVALVEALPKGPRLLWDGAQLREFNVGIEAAARSPLWEWRIHPTTLEGVARVNGQIIITVYAPERLRRLAARRVGPQTGRRTTG